MVKKFNLIYKLSDKDKAKFLKPFFEDNPKRVSYRDFSKEQRHEIQKANTDFFYKLDRTTSCLNSEKWEKDFQRSRRFKKNICEFPIINFQKTKQIKLEREKSFNERRYCNTIINNSNNRFNRSNFRNTDIYKPERNNTENQDDINNEHFSGGETVEKDENKEINLVFVIKEKRFNVKCKIKDFFGNVIDKFYSDNKIDKNEIEEFNKKGEKDGKEYIDKLDSVENNNLKDNDEIIAKIKK